MKPFQTTQLSDPRATSLPTPNYLYIKTCDLEEAIDAVRGVYCAHTVKASGPSAALHTELKVIQPGNQMIAHLRYSVPVVVDAGTFPNLLLMMTASSGAASVEQGRQSVSWRAGQTVPLSPGRETLLQFDRGFAQTSLRVDIDRLEDMCAKWLGHPLDRPITFDLQPLSPASEAIWQDAIRLMGTLASAGTALPRNAANCLDEFLLSTVLHSHRHNFFDELSNPMRAAAPRLVIEAKKVFKECVESGTTVSEVARQLGVSVRSLQAGFHAAGEATPLTYLRRVRLEAARRMLTSSGPNVSVTDVALSLGFSHAGRFSLHYKHMFGEMPVETLRRSRHRLHIRGHEV